MIYEEIKILMRKFEILNIIRQLKTIIPYGINKRDKRFL